MNRLLKHSKNITKQDTIKQIKRLHTEAEKSNPRGGKDTQEQVKEKKILQFPLLGVSQKYQVNRLKEEPVRHIQIPLLSVQSW